MDLSGHIVCEGTLRIDGAVRVLNGTRIDARRVFVGTSGSLLVGSSEQPADGVEFYLRHDAASCVEGGTSGGSSGCADGSLLSMGTVRIHGVRKTPWSLLAADAPAGSASLVVTDCEGWRTGDPIVIAATGGEVTPPGLER